MKNVFTIIIVAVVILGLGACRAPNKEEPQGGKEVRVLVPPGGPGSGTGSGTEDGSPPGNGPGLDPEAGQRTGEERDSNGNIQSDGPGSERDNLSGDPEVGEIVEDITNPVTGARVYEEMQETPYGLRSRVIVEYRGVKTEMQPSSAFIGFSPDSRYVLYIAGLAPEKESGTYLYNIETERTQELISEMLETDPRYKPFPDLRYMQWGNGQITYARFGQTWTLTYNTEE